MDDYEPYLDEGYETDLYAEADLAAIFETPVKEGEE